MKLNKVFAPLVLVTSLSSVNALATQEFYEPEPLPTTSSPTQTNEQNTNVTITPEQLQNMNNQQLIDFINENNFTSNQVAQLQSHLSTSQNTALNNAVQTGDVTFNDGDVTTNLSFGDITVEGSEAAATVGDVKTGDNVYAPKTEVEGSWSMGFGNVYAPGSDHPCKASSGWGFGLSLGYNGGGQIQRSSQDVAKDECLDKIQEHRIEYANVFAGLKLMLQNDRQAHERWIKIMDHGLDRTYLTVSVEGKEQVKLGPARAVEHGTIWGTEIKANWAAFIEYTQQLDALAKIMFTDPDTGEFDAAAQRKNKPHRQTQTISTTEIDLVLLERNKQLIAEAKQANENYRTCMDNAGGLMDQFNGQDLTKMDEDAIESYIKAMEVTSQLVEKKQALCEAKKFTL